MSDVGPGDDDDDDDDDGDDGDDAKRPWHRTRRAANVWAVSSPLRATSS
jgi:hypothetical protein